MTSLGLRKLAERSGPTPEHPRCPLWAFYPQVLADVPFFSPDKNVLSPVSLLR